MEETILGSIKNLNNKYYKSFTIPKASIILCAVTPNSKN
jgi:hypothetical protein